MDTAAHQAEILDQFTQQAEPFLARHKNTSDALLALMADCASPRAGDTVLDVACGPGIVSSFFAPRVRHVVGLDIVPAMLDNARRLQSERGLQNVEWMLGQATSLPFDEGAFDLVVTRFSFHHFLDPLAVLREMRRVCKKGGTVAVADVTPSQDTQAMFNEWEILRDPSHTRALTAEELGSVGDQAGLTLRRFEHFQLEMNLDQLLAGSFPKPGDADRIRALFEEDLRCGSNTLGVAARSTSSGIGVMYPVSVAVWAK